MNEQSTSVFMMELVHQAEAATIAAEDLNAALARRHANGIPRAFAAVQSLLAAGAMVSKILWPKPAKPPTMSEKEHADRQRALDRGRHLRQTLGIQGMIPVLESRKVRNSFEHFDDRLDAFLATSPGTVVDRNIGPGRNSIIIDGRPALQLRLIDPDQGTISVLDDDVSMQDLFDAIQDVAGRANAWLARSAT